MGRGNADCILRANNTLLGNECIGRSSKFVIQQTSNAFQSALTSVIGSTCEMEISN